MVIRFSLAIGLVITVSSCGMFARLFGTDGPVSYVPESVDISVPSLEDASPTAAAENGWHKDHLTDGVTAGRPAGSAAGPNMGWSSASTTMPQIITLTFSAPVAINTVSLYPRNGDELAGANFPTKYKIQVSTDGQTYTTVSSYGYDLATRSIGGAARTVVDTDNGVSHDFDPTETENVRIHIDETSGDRTQLSEVEVGMDESATPGNVDGQEPSPPAPAPATVDPIDYVLHDSTDVYEDPRPGKGDIQGLVHYPNTYSDGYGRFYYVKNPSEGWRFERYWYDPERIYLERDTTWPAEDNGGFQAYDALQHEPDPSGGWVPYDAFVLAETTGMTVGHHIDFDAYICGFSLENPDGGDYDWTALRDTIYWPGRRTLVYHNASLDTTTHFSSDSQLGSIDVIVLEIAVQPNVDSRPTKTERHWYARGFGWVRWQVWNDPATDPNFSDVLHSIPDNEVIFYRKREDGMPALEAFSTYHYQNGVSLPWLTS
jgi:hypothetical protein